MARYDVFANPDAPGFLLDVQTDLLSDINTRMVVPLWPCKQAPGPLHRLNPVFEIEETGHVMLTQVMAAIPASMLTVPVINLHDHSDAITNALDMLFHGF